MATMEAEYMNATSKIIQTMIGPILKQMAEQSQQNQQILRMLANKPNTSTGGGTGGGGGGGATIKKKCKHCGKQHHKDGDAVCWELEENAEKWPDGWKSVKSN